MGRWMDLGTVRENEAATKRVGEKTFNYWSELSVRNVWSDTTPDADADPDFIRRRLCFV